MPPLRSGRASKACDHCRRNKTRCYAGTGTGNTCLRCHTLSLPCSLKERLNETPFHSPPGAQKELDMKNKDTSPNRKSSTDERLERLERTVKNLVDRLDAQANAQDQARLTVHATSPRVEEPGTPSELNPAPVILIRDAADDAGVASQERSASQPDYSSDVISTGLITMSTAHSLLKLWIHYGRWVRFPDHVSTEVLLTQVRNSSLLLCSVLLIAVRHSTQALADELAPTLFYEAKTLISKDLLEVPRSIEYFQATLILSLWSTTIGQFPLSIDSWLLTGYALQQGLASPCFPGLFNIDQNWAIDKIHLDALCLWVHLCVAHLQYCVGTRRHAMLNQHHIDSCQRIFDNADVPNYETRMVAEVKLYWVIYEKCCPQRHQVDLPQAKMALQGWRKEWASLFNGPRSQFLQMSFHFAHLLAYYQSFGYHQSSIDASIILEMIGLASSIINLAIDTTDSQTRHLTDHIYHVVTFSALTLCRLVHEYYTQLLDVSIDVIAIDRLIMKLITWLHSIGLSCHAAHLLGDIVLSRFKKLRPGSSSISNDFPDSPEPDYRALSSREMSPLVNSVDFVFPDLIRSELFDMGDGSSWPQWN